MAVLIPATHAPAKCGPKGRGGLWLAALILLCSLGTESFAQTAADREYQIKAAFVFNFAQFVDWPAAAFTDRKAPLVIGILGEDPFKTYLSDIVRGETAKSHPIVIERYRRVEEIRTCHVLCISQSEYGRLEEILASLQGRNILTVGDAEGFARRGGMIRFVTDNNKVRFRINLDAARAASLTISSKLLRPAEIVARGRD